MPGSPPRCTTPAWRPRPPSPPCCSSGSPTCGCRSPRGHAPPSPRCDRRRGREPSSGRPRHRRARSARDERRPRRPRATDGSGGVQLRRATLRAMSTAAPNLRGRTVPSWTATLVLAGCWLAAGPATPDLAAQVYRAALFAAHGFAVWDNGWYDGHHLPGYSLVFPAVGSVLGVRVTGAVAAVISAALFGSLVRGRRAEAASWWFAIGCVADLLVGRLTYALGVAAGLGAVWGLTRDRPAAAVALAVACGATSPVAGLFLALVGVGVALAEQRPRAMSMSAAALATAVVLSVAFPEGGTQPFSFAAFAETVAICGLAALVVGGDRRMRPALLLYIASVVACFLVASPLGSNVTRLATAFLGALLLLASLPASAVRRRLLIVTLVAAAAWQWVDPITQAARGVDDRSTAAMYYRPLVGELRRAGVGASRVEVPFTRNHWETVYLARHFALARGWERQLDRRLNPLFYEPRLDSAAFDRWLRANAVRYVALPDAPIDPAGRPEARLVATRPPFLREIWRSAHWRLFRVRDPLPLASGPVARGDLGATDLRLRVRRSGRILLRVHWTRYWALDGGRGCVAPDGPWTILLARWPGTFRLSARFSVGRVLHRAAECGPPSRSSWGPAPTGAATAGSPPDEEAMGRRMIAGPRRPACLPPGPRERSEEVDD